MLHVPDSSLFKRIVCLSLVVGLLAAPSANCSPGASALGDSVVGTAHEEGSAARANDTAAAHADNSSAARANDHAAAHPLLKGSVSETVSPFAADGSKNAIPQGTSISLTMMANINSELTHVGDEIAAMVSIDVKDKDGHKVILPGFWCVHGVVNDVQKQKRLGRDGFVSVKFDKLISPDGKFQVPIDAVASTKDSTAKTVAKVVAKDTYMVSKGAVGGAIASIEWGGIPLAVATHGYSVAIGAGVGASLGLFAALKRKGKIANGLCGEELKFRLDQPIELPAFNEQALPSAMPIHKIENLDIVINKFAFRKSPFGDKASRLLDVDFKMDNQTDHSYSIGSMVVVSDHNKMYLPYAFGGFSSRLRTVAPKTAEKATITFDVDNNKRKYFLVLLDHSNTAELTRVPVN